jgi:hypothetical protein
MCVSHQTHLRVQQHSQTPKLIFPCYVNTTYVTSRVKSGECRGWLWIAGWSYVPTILLSCICCFTLNCRVKLRPNDTSILHLLFHTQLQGEATFQRYFYLEFVVSQSIAGWSYIPTILLSCICCFTLNCRVKLRSNNTSILHLLFHTQLQGEATFQRYFYLACVVSHSIPVLYLDYNKCT